MEPLLYSRPCATKDRHISPEPACRWDIRVRWDYILKEVKGELISEG